MAVPVRSVIFDWGGVLIDEPSVPLRTYCANYFGVSVDQLTEAMGRYFPAFQRGRPEPEVWASVCGELGVGLPRTASLWGDAFRAVYSPKEEVWDLARRVKAEGYALGFLSNCEPPMVGFFQEQGYDLLDVAVFSCVERVAKPEPEIYHRTIQRLGVTAPEAVFIDDREVYIAGAQKVGLQTIQFKDAAQVQQELRALGVRI